MSLDPARYATMPASVPLPTAPRLEIWDAAGSPSQSTFIAYLGELEQLAAPFVRSTPEVVSYLAAVCSSSQRRAAVPRP